MTFHKLHGLGNDFVLIDGRISESVPTASQIKAWADRRTGVGFDQLIYLSQQGEILHYRFFNADGSEAEQCGNGQRALALYLHRTGWQQWPVTVHGLGGDVVLDLKDKDRILVTLKPQVNIETKDIGVAADVGNPHWVIRQDNLDEVDWSRHTNDAASRFPDGVNIELVQPLSKSTMKIRVHERGVGETLACGSGACAAAWVGHVLMGMDQQIQVQMPGGDLTIVCDVNHDRITMIGSARYVFQGVFQS